MELDYFLKKREGFIEKCNKCGICAKKCPVIKETEIRDFSPQKIQKSVYDCIKSKETNDIAHIRAFSCMECFKCTIDDCPQGLNPLITNEIIKSIHNEKKQDESIGEKVDPYKNHKILSQLQTDEKELRRIKSVKKSNSKYLFFPGCNVYQQPEKILNTLDVLDMIGKEYSFLPGLENCCGDRCYYSGDLEEGINLTNKFLEAVNEFKPEVLLLWCPTCHTRFSHYLEKNDIANVKIMSVHEYILENYEHLKFSSDFSNEKVTLHEACKSSYTGVDNDAPRKLLEKIPGIKIVEMKNNKKNTKCCGSGTITWYPDIFEDLIKKRIIETKNTETEKLVTVCHFCEQSFIQHEQEHGFTVTNVINILAGHLGISRHNKLREYIFEKKINNIPLENLLEEVDIEYSYQEIKRTLDSFI